EKVRVAIQRGVQFLRDQQTDRDNWEVDVITSVKPGGETSLALLALLNCGVRPDDPAIERGLKYLRSVELRDTYVVGLQTMVFSPAAKEIDRERVQRGVDWLVKARVMNGNTLQGWGYKSGDFPDNSNTQYALLGLHEGHQAGAKVDRAVWESIRDFYIRTQEPGGGWRYRPGQSQGPLLTMTTAGACGLYIAGLELNEGREKIRPDGTADNCGQYEENKSLAQAHGWIANRFQLDFRT